MADQDKGTNGYNAKQIEALKEEVLAERDSIVANNKRNSERNASHRGNIAAIYKRAKKLSINIAALKEIVRSTVEDKQREERRAGMDSEDGNALELMLDALGQLAGTPLGDAAVAANGVDDQVADNVRKLKAGIKQKQPRGAGNPEALAV